MAIRLHQGRDGLTPSAFRKPVVTIGMFDGIHRGHRHVLEHLRSFADGLDGEAVVVTFDTHPMAVIADAPPRRILSDRHRMLLMERLGVDAMVLLPFDEPTRNTTYDDFVREILVDGIGIEGLLFGYNSNFGFEGKGTPNSVAPLAAAHGFQVVEAPAISLHGRPISSSRIRNAIEDGELAVAAEMLGRPPALYGVVVKGDGRGRTLGFPTANVDLEGELMPPSGVYQVIADVRGQRYAAVANIGVRPTFDPDGNAGPSTPVLEVHIPNLDFEFYDERIEVELVRKIRDERKFPSKEALVAQIEEDVASLGL